MVQAVRFISDGLVLAGNLYSPDDLDSAKKYPAILVGGSWTTVKEQMSGLYAGELAKQGFITLAIDPRYFGESEGQPRFWENPTAKTADFKNAITYLQTVEGVDPDQLFLVSVCASSGYMVNLAAEDERIKALATVAAWLHDAESVKGIYGGEEAIKTKISQAQAAKKKFGETGEVDYIPAISTTDKNAAMYGEEFDYYLKPDRGAIPEWSADKFAVMSWTEWLELNSIDGIANRINVPTTMVHSDSAALPQNVRRFYSLLPTGSQQGLVWTQGEHTRFYDTDPYVSQSATTVANHFNRTLR